MGRLGADPECTVTPNGSKVCNVSLATSEKYKDKSGEMVEQTEWHKLVFWNRQAEIVSQFAKSGSRLDVQGKLRTQKWEKDGANHYTTSVHVREFILLDKKPVTGEPPGNDKYIQDHHDEFAEDDLPY